MGCVEDSACLVRRNRPDFEAADSTSILVGAKNISAELCVALENLDNPTSSLCSEDRRRFMFNALGIVDLPVGDLEGTDVLTAGSEDPDHVASLNRSHRPTECGHVAGPSAWFGSQPHFERLAVHLAPGIVREPVNATVVCHDEEVLAALRPASSPHGPLRNPRPANVGRAA